MQFQSKRFALIAGWIITLCAVVLGGQKGVKANPNPPASPQAKTLQPATHFTQGTITSIGANIIVISKKASGKTEQVTFAMNSQTQRSGNLTAGTRVSIQYREGDKQKIAAVVQELPSKETAKSGKTNKP